MVNGKKIATVWHVDDLKILHVDKTEIAKIISKLEKQYGKDTYGNYFPSIFAEGRSMII